VLTSFLRACELKNKVATLLFAVALLLLPLAVAASASAPARSAELRRDLAVAGYTSEGVQEHAAEGGHHDESIGGMIMSMGWPVANFIIFVGVLYYFFNKPFSEYLAGRSASIRKDLVEAAALKSAATAQLAQIEQKLAAIPGEIAALRTRGAEEIRAEEQRIAAAAASERERLLEQTRREIDLQVRLAKQEILEHAAGLSVQLATERIRKEVTPEDQARLVDRYLEQVKKS
jgi:F-type H+-transporting ATPase subunit b